MVELNIHYQLENDDIWGMVKSINDGAGLCNVLTRADGQIDFSLHEINAWINEGILTKKVYPYWVTMTDKALSGWGMSRNKTNKLIIYCESYEQAIIVSDNAESRSEMKYINIRSSKPYYNSDRYYVSRHNIEDYNSWFIPNYFRRAQYENSLKEF